MRWYYLFRKIWQPFYRPFLVFIINSICFFWQGSTPLYAKQIKKITTPHFRILFDARMTQEAQYVAGTLENLYGPVSKTLGIRPRPIRVCLYRDSTMKQGWGLTSTTPRYISIGFSCVNPYMLGNLNWKKLLCIHEFRHVVQQELLYRSMKPWYGIIYGMDPFFIPKFLSEGDAVGIETALSKSGRGRFPQWEILYKVNLLERGMMCFDKQCFGSFQYEIPDFYRVGYYLTTHIRRKYGAHAMQAIFRKSAQRFPIFGFFYTIKSITKRSFSQLYRDMNQELLGEWQKQLNGLPITPATHLTPKSPTTTVHYTHPFMDPSGNIIATKSGIGVRSQLVSLVPSLSHINRADDAQPGCFQEKRMLYQAVDDMIYDFSMSGQCCVWLEPCLHPWKGRMAKTQDGNMNKSGDMFRFHRLQYYDFAKKKRRTLAKNKQYHAVAMSATGTQLVVIESDETWPAQLVILETQSGKVVAKIPNPDAHTYLTPRWHGEHHIVVVQTKDQYNSIVQIHVPTGKVELLLPPADEHRNSPQIYKDFLLYNSSYNGIDNIYAMHLQTKECFQVTSRKYGSYLGMVDPVTNQLVFSDYTKHGMAIAVMPFEPHMWRPLSSVTDRSVRYYAPLVAQENNPDVLEQPLNHAYPITDLKWTDSLSFDGMGISSDSASIKNGNFTGAIGSLQGNCNIFSSLGYNLNNILERKRIIQRFALQVQYQTAYPILSIDLNGGTRDPREEWQWIPMTGISFPYALQFASSSAYALLYLGLACKKWNDRINIRPKCVLEVHHESTKCPRDIVPPWQQALTINFEPDMSMWDNDMISLQLSLCFPGCWTHHYIKCKPEYSKQLSTNGHEFASHFSYGFPVAYPDAGLPLILYIRRIHMELNYSIRTGTMQQIDHTMAFSIHCLQSLFTLPNFTIFLCIPFWRTNQRTTLIPSIGCSIPFFN